MNHRIECQCGKLKGDLDQHAWVNHAVCFCADCQAFAHFLGRADQLLDAQGGSSVLQTQPRHLRFSEGVEHLACMRLTDNGMLRWYSSCCQTPIGNTLATPKVSFIGLITDCLKLTPVELEQAFGPVRMQVNTGSAKGEPKPPRHGLLAGMLRVAGLILRARLNGSYRQTAFFDATTGQPIKAPKVLSPVQWQRLRQAL
ncbi:MAG: DUF6151 family protein [Pseudomonas sp.]|uniref:DUF6151 family protein n=1 Tax=Pseudomonas sp. TaxID=306 RepID=UPI003399BDDF